MTAPTAEHGVNVPLLQQVLDHITDNPETWDQTDWCGTSCCVAGHVALAQGWQRTNVHSSRVRRDGEERSVSQVAREALGLTPDDAERLFDGGNSLRELWAHADQLTGGAIQPSYEQQVEVRRIDVARNRAW